MAKWRNRLSRFGEGLTAWLVGWWSVPPVLVEDEHEGVRRHAIVIGSAGYALKILPRSEVTDYHALLRNRRMGDAGYDKYLREMMTHLKEEYAAGKCPNGVLIFIHGGHEAPRKTVHVSCKLYGRVQKERPDLRDRYYPIFINWDASLWRAYVQQLLRIRSGVYTRWALASWYFYLAADIARGVALLLPELGLYFKLLWKSRSSYAQELTIGLERFTTPELTQEGKWPRGLGVRETVQIALAIPVQILVLLITGTGVPRAWGNLQRRARAMFRAPREFEWGSAPDGSGYEDCEGAMAVFLRALDRTVKQCPGMKVTVVAHSMGAMIANETLRYRSGLPFASIVYLAPACSVREFADAVSPILAKPGMAKTESPEAYVLTLHPRVEAGQRDVRGWIGGSVLEWLEGSLAAPHSYLDRTLGKWDNALRTLHTFEPQVREHLHLKSFLYHGNARKPCRHADFYHPDLDPPFWSTDFWA